jgi:predicted RNase H-like nuclease (RuvC/YqgF family)
LGLTTDRGRGSTLRPFTNEGAEAMNTIRESLELLERETPLPDLLPERMEALNLASFDTADHIRQLQDDAGKIEEEATAEASSESNETKRKTRRAEILRDDEEYARLQAEIRAAERVKLQLDERSHRLAREYRAHLLNREINHLGRRAA